jgi:hydrogenase maturation protease
MSDSVSGNTVVIGIGNPDRRDDAAGLEVARRLRAVLPDSIRVIEESGEATALMNAWEGAECAVVIDAMASGGTPGLVQRFEVQDEPLPAQVLRCSTHDLGLPEAIELSRRLGMLPSRLVVYGIEGEDFGHGRGLSPSVARAIDLLVCDIEGELSSATPASSSPFRPSKDASSRA